MKVMKYGLAAASLIVLSGTVFAKVPQLLGKPFGSVTEGFYVGVNVGYADSAPYLALRGATKSNEEHSGIAAGAFGGYQLNGNFAAEAGYNYFPKYKVKLTSGGTTVNNSLNVSQIYAAGKLIIPFAERFNIFAALGVSANQTAASVTSEDHTKLDKENLVRPYGAAGFGYYVTQNVQLLAQVSAVTDHAFALPFKMIYGNAGISYII